MHDLPRWVACCKVGRIANHAIIKSCADREENIGILHRHVGFNGAVHPEHAHKLLIRCRVGTEAHERVGTRETQHPHQFGDLFGGIPQYGAATNVDHRARGAEQHLHRLFDLTGVALHDGPV